MHETLGQGENALTREKKTYITLHDAQHGPFGRRQNSREISITARLSSHDERLGQFKNGTQDT